MDEDVGVTVLVKEDIELKQETESDTDISAAGEVKDETESVESILELYIELDVMKTSPNNLMFLMQRK